MGVKYNRTDVLAEERDVIYFGKPSSLDNSSSFGYSKFSFGNSLRLRSDLRSSHFKSFSTSSLPHNPRRANAPDGERQRPAGRGTAHHPNSIKQCRRIATRYDKLAANYPGLSGGRGAARSSLFRLNSRKRIRFDLCAAPWGSARRPVGRGSWSLEKP